MIYLIGFISTLGAIKYIPYIGFVLYIPFVLFALSVISRIAIGLNFRIGIQVFYILLHFVYLAFGDNNTDSNFDFLLYTYFPLVVFYLRSYRSSDLNKFLSGFKIGYILNYIYALMFLTIFHGFDFNISEYIFTRLFSIPYEVVWDLSYSIFGINTIRVSGLSWDPMHIGFLSAIYFVIALYAKNKTNILLALIMIFLSGSRTGLLGIIAVLMYYVAFDCKDRKVRLIIYFMTIVTMIVMILLIIDRDMNAYGNIRRAAYFVYLPSLFFSSDIPTIIFGKGLFASGNFAYELAANAPPSIFRDSMIQANYSGSWGLEGGWVSLLLGRGLFLFIIFTMVIIYSILATSGVARSLLICVAFMNLTYTYEFSLLLNFFIAYALGLRRNRG